MKKRTLNEYRQTKEYQGTPWDTSKYGGGFEDVAFSDLEDSEKLKKLEEAHKIPEEIQKTQEELEYKEWANEANNSKQMKENRKYKDIAGDIDLIDAAKEQIIKQLQDDFYDVIFQAVADKMNENYMFKENNYFTEAGMDEFEDAWFEWYHNHHGDILTAVLKNLGH